VKPADPPDLLAAALPRGIEGWFTTRRGGVSRPPWEGLNLAAHVGDQPAAVRRNNELLLAALPAAGVAFAHQVHGAGVLVVDEPLLGSRIGYGAPRRADALVTALPGVALGVLVADCLPVLIADPSARVVAAVHAGRRGLVAGVLQAALQAMVGLGADPAHAVAVIGPAICGRCYEVPPAMCAEVAEAVAGTASRTPSGTSSLDLAAGAAALLADAGVAATTCGVCTAEDARFYSYRRDGVTGRFAGVVMVAADG
jgi:YfiH family protein